MLLLHLLGGLALLGLLRLASLARLLGLLGRLASRPLFLSSGGSSLLPGNFSLSGSLLLHLGELDCGSLLLLSLLGLRSLLSGSLLDSKLALLLVSLLLLDGIPLCLLDLLLLGLDLGIFRLLELLDAELLSLLLGSHSLALLSLLFGGEHALTLSFLHLALFDGKLSLALSLSLSALDLLRLLCPDSSGSLLGSHDSASASKSLSAYYSLIMSLKMKEDVPHVVSMVSCMDHTMIRVPVVIPSALSLSLLIFVGSVARTSSCSVSARNGDLSLTESMLLARSSKASCLNLLSLLNKSRSFPGGGSALSLNTAEESLATSSNSSLTFQDSLLTLLCQPSSSLSGSLKTSLFLGFNRSNSLPCSLDSGLVRSFVVGSLFDDLFLGNLLLGLAFLGLHGLGLWRLGLLDGLLFRGFLLGCWFALASFLDDFFATSSASSSASSAASSPGLNHSLSLGVDLNQSVVVLRFDLGLGPRLRLRARLRFGAGLGL